MPATVVVGGQYGSEGKGKVVALLAARSESPWLVRCGGPNSGHTVTLNGENVVFRQVPSNSNPRRGTFCVAAGCVVDEALLLNEVDSLGIEPDRVVVDPRAVLLAEDDREAEHQLQHIGSTQSGTGAALVRRMSRAPGVRLVKDSAAIRNRCRVETLAPLLHDALDKGEQVIVEGTQGFALSLLHGADYPFVTSRDTTAAGFAMEVGLSPLLVSQIVMVVRTFPIRVGGTSGPFSNEVTWSTIRDLSGAPSEMPEYTSVTNRLRRVARFDIESVIRACAYNRPTSLAVMGLDRLDYRNCSMTNASQLTDPAIRFLGDLEFATRVRVEFVGTGFRTFDVVTVPVESRSSIFQHG